MARSRNVRGIFAARDLRVGLAIKGTQYIIIGSEWLSNAAFRIASRRLGSIRQTFESTTKGSSFKTSPEDEPLLSGKFRGHKSWTKYRTRSTRPAEVAATTSSSRK